MDFIPIFSFFSTCDCILQNTGKSFRPEIQPDLKNVNQHRTTRNKWDHFPKPFGKEFFWTLNVPYILFPWLTGFIQTEFEFNGDTTVQHTLAVKPSGSGSPLLNSVASEVRCICCGVSFKIITKIESVIWLQIRLD